jgi:hypothetical protein
VDCVFGLSHRCSLRADANGGFVAQVSRVRHAWGAGHGDRSPRRNSQLSKPQR